METHAEILIRYQNRLDELKNKYNRAQGKLEAAMEEAEKEFGTSSISELKDKYKEMEQKISKLQDQIIDMENDLEEELTVLENGCKNE